MIPCPNIVPYALSEVERNANIISLNYTNQDFWSMKTRLVGFIQEQFLDDFNDFVESSLAIMLVENFAFIADTLSFKIDQIANEIFIDTVTELDNAFRLAKLVGFQPTPPIAARSLWSATISGAYPQELRISCPYRIDLGTPGGSIPLELFPADSNNNAILDEDIIVPAGEVSVTSIVGLQGETIEKTYESAGEISQSYLLPDSDISYNSVRVFVDGTQWEQVDYFTDSQPRKEFRLEYNSDYSAYIIFGNNRAGLIPTSGSIITASYRVCNGIRGNIISTISAQGTVGVSEYPYYLPFTFTNYTKGEYGYNGDTLEDIRRKLPEYLRTQDRAVTGTDYKTLTDHYASDYHGQIGKSVAALRNYGCAANIVDLYVLAKENENDLAEASTDLKFDLQQYIDSKKMFTDYVCIRDGSIVETDIQLDVTVNRLYKKFEEELKVKVQKRLDMFFNLVNWEYGQSLKDTDIIKILSDITEIIDTNITFTTNNPANSGQLVTTKFYEIIRPSETIISFLYT